jgi:hypothetical protein
MYWCKVFQTRQDLVVALCDENLLGKEIGGSDVRIKVSENFYGGKVVSETVAVRLMKKASIGNIIGKSIVELAEKNGFITRENVIDIDDVPHAQFVQL